VENVLAYITSSPIRVHNPDAIDSRKDAKRIQY